MDFQINSHEIAISQKYLPSVPEENFPTNQRGKFLYIFKGLFLDEIKFNTSKKWSVFQQHFKEWLPVLLTIMLILHFINLGSEKEVNSYIN